MDIYKKRSYWNILLATFGMLILIITLVYSNFLAQKLKDREEQNVKIFAEAVEELNKRNADVGKKQNPIISKNSLMIMPVPISMLTWESSERSQKTTRYPSF